MLELLQENKMSYFEVIGCQSETANSHNTFPKSRDELNELLASIYSQFFFCVFDNTKKPEKSLDEPNQIKII